MSYDLLRLKPGARVLDVGCGTGRAVAELADRDVAVIGIDSDDRMLAMARARSPELDVRSVDATAPLPWAVASFDAYRADKVVHLFEAPGAALAEAARVLAPGGRIVLVGQDWDAFIIDSDEDDLTRRIVEGRAAAIPGRRVARRHRNLLLDAGFTDVDGHARIEIFTGQHGLAMLTRLAAGSRATVTDDERTRWLAEQRDRAAADRLFLAIPMFVAAGSRPSYAL